jgi:hypothetical protein
MYRQGKVDADKALGQCYLLLKGLYPAIIVGRHAGIHWPPTVRDLRVVSLVVPIAAWSIR